MSSTNEDGGWSAVILVPLVSAAVTTLIGWRPTRANGGWAALEAMMAAQAVVLAAVYVTVLPTVSRMRKAAPLDRLAMGFKAGGLRLVITVAAALGVIAADIVAKRPFLLWIGMAYLVTTLAETIALTRWMKQTR